MFCWFFFMYLPNFKAGLSSLLWHPERSSNDILSLFAPFLFYFSFPLFFHFSFRICMDQCQWKYTIYCAPDIGICKMATVFMEIVKTWIFRKFLGLVFVFIELTETLWNCCLLCLDDNAVSRIVQMVAIAKETGEKSYNEPYLKIIINTIVVAIISYEIYRSTCNDIRSIISFIILVNVDQMCG